MTNNTACGGAKGLRSICSFQLHVENRIPYSAGMPEKESQRVERLLLGRIRAVPVIHHRCQEPIGRLQSPHFTLTPCECGVALHPCAVTSYRARSQTAPCSRRPHCRPDPFRQAPVFGSFLRTSVQPVQIPLDGILPLLQLPGLPWPILRHHFFPPECLGRITSLFKAAAHPEIFEPLQNQHKHRSFSIGESTELRKISSPAVTRSFDGHDGSKAFPSPNANP